MVIMEMKAGPEEPTLLMRRIWEAVRKVQAKRPELRVREVLVAPAAWREIRRALRVPEMGGQLGAQPTVEGQRGESIPLLLTDRKMQEPFVVVTELVYDADCSSMSRRTRRCRR